MEGGQGAGFPPVEGGQGASLASSPGSNFAEADKRAWYPLFAHAPIFPPDWGKS